MKKIFAILMALVLTFAMSAVAMADELTSVTTIDKTWTVNKTGANVYPTCPITFEMKYSHAVITSDAAYTPDATLTATYNPETQKITIPSANDVTFTKAGIFVYAITETAVTGAQGVTSSDNGTVYVQYVAEYVDGTDGERTIKVTGPYLAQSKDGNQATKKGSFTNGYTVYDLTVTKSIIGNFADVNKEFTVNLAFTSSDKVYSTIGGATVTWDAEKSTDDKYHGTAQITVTNNNAVTISNIPKDVEVTVTEAANTDGYKATYAIDGGNASEDPAEVTMTKDRSVVITNTKEQNVNTGITMDSIPYIVLLAVAVVGIAALTMKKRYEA